MRGLEGDAVDLLVTDPPYGISFMGKSWDKALPFLIVPKASKSEKNKGLDMAIKTRRWHV